MPPRTPIFLFKVSINRQRKNKLKKTTKALIIALVLTGAGSVLVFRGDPNEWKPRGDGSAEYFTHRRHASGPLRRNVANPLYFTDNTGKAIYLTGSHVWNNFQDIDPALWPDANGKLVAPETKTTSKFDFDNYLRLLEKENHNFIRLWAWENAAWFPGLNTKPTFQPLAYSRSGPGIALDGLPKFNLKEFNQDYFDRLRSRVSAANERGVYVSVMLFQGCSIARKGTQEKRPWLGHPFNRANNVNGMDGDPSQDDEGTEIHTLQVPEVTAQQESYVRKAVATLNDLDNVLWEISNESEPTSRDWQYHMINFLKRCEADQPKQHPVGMTLCQPGGKNVDLFASPADWISPGCSKEENYCENPPAGHGRKVIISDTDHLWGIGGDRAWVWKSFTRGLNPIFMDPIERPRWESVRRAMGITLAYADRMNLSSMKPHGDLASSGYCLANPGREYLVYVPLEVPSLESRRFFHRFKQQIRNIRRLFGTRVTVDLLADTGPFQVEWLNPSSGEKKLGRPVQGGTKVSFTAPFRGDAVLYIRRETQG